jgi:hypothetical protein
MLSQQDIEHQQHLLREDTYTAWLYQNYTINNGDMLLHYLEDSRTRDLYLREHGLDSNSEFTDDKGNVL